ncbi:MAG: triose-phosphate isomerase [Rhodospirillaceae bacterium]|nr:triose-phosphate isomerase [Rhodospirillaceae bacterium]
MTSRHLIAGNWKMNLQTTLGTELADTLAEYARTAGHIDMLICPPTTLLASIWGRIACSSLRLGGQDCHAKISGAHTGEISAAMLRDVGCSHVIVGHSERRTNNGEDDLTVRAKAEAAQAAGLVTIVCVGETMAERDTGNARMVVERQLRGSLPNVSNAAKTVVAYEPVWAIGTGKTATLCDIAEMHGHIRRVLCDLMETGAEVRILYGGSVKPENSMEILAAAEVSGALVGGASLKAKDFIAIAESVPK